MKRKLKKKDLYKYFIFLIALAGCQSEPEIPKPQGYFRIALPEKSYESFSHECGFSFEKNTHAVWMKAQQKCWGNIRYPSLKAEIQFTFANVEDNLSDYINSAQDLAYKHTVKADGIREIMYENPSHKTYGLFYQLQGQSASPIQFFLTDSTENFLRGALYFYASPNSDSLKPVTQFMEEEIKHIMETTTWKNG